MKNKEHLSPLGIGPLYGAIIILMTAAGIVLSVIGLLESGKSESLKIMFIITGIFIIIYGISVWFRGAFRIDRFINSNKLCTEGIYAIVRNPCYSGITLICIGTLFIEHNIKLLVLPFFYWALMTILLKCTEEKWLLRLYGQEYAQYCKRVNRCIPWFKKK